MQGRSSPPISTRRDADGGLRFEQLLRGMEATGGDQPPERAPEQARLAWAARELEAFFIQELWRAMRRSIPKGGLFPSSAGSRTFEEMLDVERSRLMAGSGQIGLAALIYERMLPYVSTDAGTGGSTDAGTGER